MKTIDINEGISSAPLIFIRMVLVQKFEAEGHEIEIYSCPKTGKSLWRMGDEISYLHDSEDDAAASAIIIASLST